MQQFFNQVNSTQNDTHFINLQKSIIIYQKAISELLMKLSTNPILPEVYNNMLTRFLSESIEASFEEDFLRSLNKNTTQLIDSSNKVFKLSNNLYKSWFDNTSSLIQNSFSGKDITQNYNKLLESFSDYNKGVLEVINNNLQRFIKDQKDEHSTVKFLWEEFSKSCNPKNIPILNQEILNEIQRTSCANLVQGAEMFLNDVENSPDGYFLINTVDKKAFELGKNIAATKGKVVFQNKLMQLICYENTTENIHKIPILIVTAWINKYYILDLDPQYSYVKWLIDNGYRVFIISWVNPDDSMSNIGFTDYLKDGLITAIDNVKQISQTDEINCIGYCMGGTLLSTCAGYLNAKNIKSIKSITLLTTLTDFERCGPVKLFITDEMLDTIEEHMKKQGYISGHDMFNTFSVIKSNDMIWHYFINKYLLGQEPKAIDVLYWNSDSTRIPYAMHKQCLRDLYQHNLLAQNKLVIDDIKIDLNSIKCPIYSFATQDDHIAPWESVYKGLRLCTGSNNKRFILSKSGHVAAVINHPEKNKYGYWFDPIDTKKSKDNKKENPQDWFEKAQYQDGSWWNDWHHWMQSSNLNGESVKAEKIPQEKILENAPGSYVTK